jgi:hypothetical protein
VTRRARTVASFANGEPQINSTPVLLIFRQTRRHRRDGRPSLKVKSIASGSSIVFGNSTPAPASLKLRTTQSRNEDIPSRSLAPLRTRLRAILRRSCISSLPLNKPKLDTNPGKIVKRTLHTERSLKRIRLPTLSREAFLGTVQLGMLNRAEAQPLPGLSRYCTSAGQHRSGWCATRLLFSFARGTGRISSMPPCAFSSRVSAAASL